MAERASPKRRFPPVRGESGNILSPEPGFFSGNSRNPTGPKMAVRLRQEKGRSMSYQSGEIYFVREYEAATSEPSPFVKIGLVADQRVSAERLLEHQTGNPRKLYIPRGHIVKTAAVSMVEAQLHRRFSKNRVGGEWFRFTQDSELLAAIELAKKLAAEAETLVPILLEAERLQRLPSTQTAIPATDEHVSLAQQLAASKEMQKRITATEKDIRAFLVSQRTKGEAIDAAADVRTVTFKPKFQEADFSENYPGIHKKYLFEVKKWEGRFLPKVKWAEEIGLEQQFNEEFSEAEAAALAAIESTSISDLGEPILTLTRLGGLVDWEETVSAGKLKVACGQAEGIDGVCTWKRSDVVREVFDLDSFVRAHPDLYTSYLSDETTKEYVLPSKGSKRK